ncbi:MAG: sodium-translocating pyrophosphatase [Thermoguttaceae bacterium]|jgi:inorganic pyrophosphatase/K(+)-stimulated pyrophosphate-energized sodium pump|nr:sodium-translocating pyrophosphatase [Thermoguttaceae bacterium]
MLYVYWAIAFGSSLVALVFAYRFFVNMLKADEGTDEMKEIALAVRLGANAYLWQQYKIVGIFFVVICALLAYMAFGLKVQSVWVPLAFLTGGVTSALAGYIGMRTATLASNRTAAGAQKSLNQGLQVAFRSGAVMGLTVVGLGLLHTTVWFMILYLLLPALGFPQMSLAEITVVMLSSGLGASSQALFARVGGGIFTKAADVGADLVGKVEAGIPEDDKRNPATIADNVGDNVGDVAGMGADLFESYCASILATSALGVAAFTSPQLAAVAGLDAGEMQLRALFLPLVLAGVGILLSVAGVFMVRTEEDATQKTLLKALARGVDLACVGVVIASVGLVYWLLPGFGGVSVSIIMGLTAGWLIGKWTEYCTSDEFAPTRRLADQSLTGPGTIVTAGIADGMRSVWAPVVIVVAAMILAFGFAAQWNLNDVTWFAMGLYGVGIAAVGMLSTLGVGLATDAYGPIADNAGGNAEMAGLDPMVRERTDALDALGNTTAATGKGFAIGSAALTALALLAAYMEEVRMGFDRWGNDVVAQQIDQPVDGQLYKVNRNLVVEVVEDEARPGRMAGRAFLVMPDDIRHATNSEAWQKLDASKGPVAIPAEVVRMGDVYGQTDVAFFAGNNGVLTDVKTASMLDWMNYYESNLMNPKVIAGVFLGAMVVFVFCAMTMQAVGRAAFGMVEEVRRQFREKPGIMTGEDKPDYAAPVAISTRAAQREMIVPSILGLAVPVVTGWIFGVAGVVGLLIGALTCGFCVAVYMANAGGAWDNAKKYIEKGAHGGKGTDAHKAAVVGDTVGDPFKDTSGPSLNILIKLMSVVSVVAAGFVVRYSLVALGMF